MNTTGGAADVAQPVAWRVKNDFGHWYVTQDEALADTYRDVEKKDVQPLYLAAQPPAAPVEPYAWVIPGDDQSRPSGSIDAMAWREGEFTKPLYAQMPAAGMSRDDAESLVFDLLDAARSFDQAETAFRRGAREYYEEVRDKVISALSIPHRSSGETK